MQQNECYTKKFGASQKKKRIINAVKTKGKEGERAFRKKDIDRIAHLGLSTAMLSTMNDEELIRYTITVMKNNKIKTLNELNKVDSQLYREIRVRNITGKVIEVAGFGIKRWNTMSDDQIIEMARRKIAQHQINTRAELRKTDAGLYMALHKRGLLGTVL